MNEISVNQQMLASMDKRGNTKDLDANTNFNYMLAVSYYTAKKQAFIRKIIKDTHREQEGLDQGELEKITEETLTKAYRFIADKWNKIDSLIYSSVMNDGSNLSYGEKVYNVISSIKNYNVKNGSLSAELENYRNKNGEEFEIIQTIFKKIGDKKIKEVLTKKQDKEYINNQLASTLGQVFEPFASQAINLFANQSSKLCDDSIDSLLGNFKHTGNIRINRPTATKAANKYISPDIAMGVTKRNANSVELTVRQNAEIKNIFHQNYLQNPSIKDATDIGQQLYNKINGNNAREQMFGFSLKRWKDGDQNKPYTSSSVIQGQLKQIFDSSGNKTWNYKYAFARAQLELSKNAIALFGPINIGVFTTKGFTWMDEFIRDRRLFMNTYSSIEPQHGEIKPYVNSGRIYIHDYNKKRKQDTIDFKDYGEDKKTKKPYYKISFKAALNKY